MIKQQLSSKQPSYSKKVTGVVPQGFSQSRLEICEIDMDALFGGNSGFVEPSRAGLLDILEEGIDAMFPASIMYWTSD